MWTRDAATEIDASAARLWALFADVAGWPAWNAGIESIALRGPFRDGSVFSMQPPGMDAFDSTLRDVEPLRGFTDETVFGDTVVRVRHAIEPLAPARVRVVFRTEATGPEAAAIGAAASADFDAVLRALKAHAEAAGRDGRHDFDFLHGRWRVQHRRLRQRLAGCTQWDAFEAEATCTPHLGGLANLETHASDALGAFGLALRLFAPATRQWSIHWANGTDATLEPPMVGAFDGDVGLFYGDDLHDGQPVRVRFTWTRRDADHAYWAQAFSADGGATWETNWTMAFARDA